MNNGPILFGAQQAMAHFQLQPSWVKGRYNQETEVERRYLYTKLYSVYEFDLWQAVPLNFFRYFLFYHGSIAAIYTKQLGWIAYPYGITKLDSYYQPLNIEVYNEWLPNAVKGVIGLNAVIIKVMDDYAGLDDLVVKYATKLANIDKAFDISLMNANVSLYAEAENPKEATEIKTAYAKATEGNPMVVVKKSLTKGQQLRSMIENPKSNFIGLELQQARGEVVNEFLKEIGIPTANYNKRAQMSDDEIRQSDAETESLCSVILANIREGLDVLNRISGMKTSVRLKFEKKVTGGGTSGTDNPLGDE